MLRRFIEKEDGAVTVDWVVLTAATVGLGVASMGVIAVGIEDVSVDTSAQLSGSVIRTSFLTLGELFSTDFSNGSEGWAGGSVEDLLGFGEVLQIGEGETVSLDLEVPSDASSATVTFDLLALDDLNNDPATIMINGETVAIYQDDHGRVTRTNIGGTGISVTTEQHYENDPVGAGSHGHDSRLTYTITVDDPSETLQFSVHSGTDDGIADEFYAIDDVTVMTQ